MCLDLHGHAGCMLVCRESFEGLKHASVVHAGHFNSSRVCTAKLDIQASHAARCNCSLYLLWDAVVVDCVAV